MEGGVLNRIGPGFVQRVPASDVGLDLIIRISAHPNLVTAQIGDQPSGFRGEHCQASEDLVHPGAQISQHLYRLGGIDRFSKDPSIQGDRSIRTKDDHGWTLWGRAGSGLAFRQPQHEVRGFFPREQFFTHIPRPDLENPFTQGQQLPAAG